MSEEIREKNKPINYIRERFFGLALVIGSSYIFMNRFSDVWDSIFYIDDLLFNPTNIVIGIFSVFGICLGYFLIMFDYSGFKKFRLQKRIDEYN